MTWVWSAGPVVDDAVLDLLTASARSTLLDGGLPPEAVYGLASMQARARLAGHRTSFPEAQHRCVADEDRLIGRVLVDMPAHGEWHLVDVVVHPDARRRGLARWMVSAVIADADSAGASVTLTAAPGAQVVDLYTQLGFTATAADATSMAMHRPSSRDSGM